jgi:hypothetical protein
LWIYANVERYISLMPVTSNEDSQTTADVPEWSPAASVCQLLNTPTDPTWVAELEDDRLAESPEDPWEK